MVLRQTSSQGAPKKQLAATSQFHSASRCPCIVFGPDQFCNGDRLKFGGLLWFICVYGVHAPGPRHTLFSSNCGIRWNATSAWEHAPGTARTNPGKIRAFPTVFVQRSLQRIQSISVLVYNEWRVGYDQSPFSTGLKRMPMRYFEYHALKKWKPSRPSFIVWPSVDCL